MASEGLLLARGACIETNSSILRFGLVGLLLARGACIETGGPYGNCDSKSGLLLARGACIETLLNQAYSQGYELLLARGACIETLEVEAESFQKAVAPRKRSMY